MEVINVEALTRQYFVRIHRAALVLSGNPWDADDLAQETFLVVARKPDRFGGRSQVFTWLYGILLNLDRRRRRQWSIHRRKLKVLGENETSRKKFIPAAETAVEVSEWKQSLWAWVNKLPEGQRHALTLRFSEELAYDEIAEILECPLGTVKSRIHHGLLALRKLMSNQDEQLRELPLHSDEDLIHAI